MPYLAAPDGTRLYYEGHGRGTPVVMAHELAGSVRSFDKQIPSWSHAYRCLPYAARGYPPSDVPENNESYSVAHALSDLGSVLDTCAQEKAHILGVSMGAYAALRYTIENPARVSALVLVGLGTGSDQPPEEFKAHIDSMANELAEHGLAHFLEGVSAAPNRAGWARRSPEDFATFLDDAHRLSVRGIIGTLRGVQRERAPVYAFEHALRGIEVPILLVVGDEDQGCLKPSQFVAATAPAARAIIMKNTGHAANIERPDEFNEVALHFLRSAVSA